MTFPNPSFANADSNTLIMSILNFAVKNLTSFEYTLLCNPPYNSAIPLDVLFNTMQKSGIPRPMNSWIIFRRIFVKNLQKLHPHYQYSTHEKSRLCSVCWADQPEIVKQYFDVLSKLSLHFHKQLYPDYIYTRRRNNRPEVNEKKLFKFKEMDVNKIIRKRSETNKISKKRKTNAGQKRNAACGENSQNVQNSNILSQQQYELQNGQNENCNVLVDNQNCVNVDNSFCNYIDGDNLYYETCWI